MKKQTARLTILLALVTSTCLAAIVTKTEKQEGLARLYEAAIDVLMTCYGDPSKGVGIIGDSDGFILMRLWSSYRIPVALIDTAKKLENPVTNENLHKLEIFVIAAATPTRLSEVMKELANSIWWNNFSYFLILSPTLKTEEQCSHVEMYLQKVYKQFGVLNAQFMCIKNNKKVLIFNSNPFTRKAPESWDFTHDYGEEEDGEDKPFSVFKRIYKKGGRTCEALNFAKTLDTGGYEFQILSIPITHYTLDPMRNSIEFYLTNDSEKAQNRARFSAAKQGQQLLGDKLLHIFSSIEKGLKAKLILKRNLAKDSAGIRVAPLLLAGSRVTLIDKTYPFFQLDLIAMTQHTSHKSQLTKISTVIDAKSRVGMYAVYSITFLFFKYFLCQTSMSAALNLVRLTCNMSLTKLPRNLAPTIYLACLFMFVVTLQAIYTGNMASLLTTQIPYPHVNTKQDLADLGYTTYTNFVEYFNDSSFDGRVVKILINEPCSPYVLNDPLAACVIPENKAVNGAFDHKLHLSRDAIANDYFTFWLTKNNPFGRRIDSILSTMIETGTTKTLEMRTKKLKWSDFVDDDEVKGNKNVKIITLAELSFVFVILGIGLTCAFLCFIAEVLIYRASSQVVHSNEPRGG